MAPNLENVPQPLKIILGGYFNVEVPALDELKTWLQNPDNFAKEGKIFKEQFRQMISKRLLSPIQFEALTSVYYPTDDELYAWLREVWSDLFDGEPSTS